MQIMQWDQVATKGVTSYVVTRIARIYLGRCGDHTLVDQVRSALERDDTQFLCSFEIPYAEVSCETAENLAAISGLFFKRSDIGGKNAPRERQEKAWVKFQAAEALCKQTNEIFRLRRKGLFQFPFHVERVLHYSQQKITQILGSVPKLADLNLRFGPGATTTVHKKQASHRHKLGGQLACSSELEPILSEVLSEMEGWVDAICDYSEDERGLVCDLPVEIVPGKVVFVPKKAEIDRTIILEPVLNSMVQLGLMDVMVKRLALNGVDLSDQTRNQRLASVGSLTNALATLDLSSASDTVATELVYDLLPLDWAHLLSRVRTGSVLCPDGSVLRLAKFSSMGNAFTFPLESLIFYGLAYGAVMEMGCSAEFVSVYGDDIVIPVEAYELLCEVLRSVGFIPNRLKSFADGPFRESCGKDYYLGLDIRPFFLRGPISGENLFKMHNFAARRGDREVCLAVLSFIHRDLRLWGPDGYGDGHLIGDFHIRVKPAHLRVGFSGFVFDTFTWSARKDFRASHFGDRILPAYSVYSRASSDLWTSASRRCGASQYRLVFGPTSSGAPEYCRGIRGIPLPGRDKYRRISIYVLN